MTGKKEGANRCRKFLPSAKRIRQGYKRDLGNKSGKRRGK